jgi:pseudouridine-5'-phosphate glycosidase
MVRFALLPLGNVPMMTMCRLAAITRRLPLIGSGMVVAVPIPEEHAAEGQSIQQAQEQALREASTSNISGSDTTPFLLERIRQITGGASLKANIQLVMNNARVAAQLSAAVAGKGGSSKL